MSATLTYEILFVGMAAQTLWYVICRFFERPTSAEPSERNALRRKRSWFLTLPISFFFGYVLGPVYVLELLVALRDGAPAVVKFLLTENIYGRVGALSMIGFMSLDLIIGSIDYREQIRMDTGWVHHTLYLMLYSTMAAYGGTQYLIAGACCEMPTFIMALGTVVPELRQELAFGVTFLFTRIIWFSLLLVVYSISSYNAWLPAYLYAPPLVAAIAMHIWWMRAWFVGMIVRRKRAKENKE
jgi:hypothetical protein